MNNLPDRNLRKSSARLLCAAAILFLSSAAIAQAQTLTSDSTVDATQGPWQYVEGGLNPGYQYGENDGNAPLVLDVLDGFDFTPGMQITVDYVSGSVHLGTGYDAPDANGDRGDEVDSNTGISGKVFRSFYLPHSEYPAHLGALVGTFADASGTIVGTPFKVGVAMPLTIPAGATQLQLGINDDVLLDNTGAFDISVSGMAAVPEPSVSILLAGALVVELAALRRQSARARRFVSSFADPEKLAIPIKLPAVRLRQMAILRPQTAVLLGQPFACAELPFVFAQLPASPPQCRLLARRLPSPRAQLPPAAPRKLFVAARKLAVAIGKSGKRST